MSAFQPIRVEKHFEFESYLCDTLYLDWGDLVKLIKKKEDVFLPYIGEMKFVENRFEELESLRNIVAHNGVLPSEDDFQRVIISFRDWCRQIGQFYSQTAQT